MQKPLNPTRILIIVGMALQLIWEGALFSQYLIHSGTTKPTDFSIFYTAGTIAASGKYESIYDIETQREVRETFLDTTITPTEVLPFNHPPILVPILQLLVSENYMGSYWRWVLCMIAFLALSMVVINKLLKRMEWKVQERVFLIFSSLIFYPVFVSLLKGQDTAFVLLGAALWVYGLLAEKDPVAGIGLSLTVIRPQIALFLAIPFLFHRRNVFLWFLAGAAAWTALSVSLIHMRGVGDFVKMLLLSAGGVDYEMFQNAMFNLTGLLLRLFPHFSLAAIHWSAWIVYGLGLVGMCIWWRSSTRIGFGQIASVVSLSLFAAPHLHYHDLALLIIPVLCLVCIQKKSGMTKGIGVALIPVSLSLFMLFADFWDPLRFSVPYAIMISLPVVTLLIEKMHAQG
jgi:hypothetical protein